MFNVSTVSRFHSFIDQGPTPLIAAFEKEQFHIALALLEWGANPRICDRTGNSLLNCTYVGCTNVDQFSVSIFFLVLIACKLKKAKRQTASRNLTCNQEQGTSRAP